MFCGGLLGPIAWAMASSYESDCRAKGIPVSGAGKAGKVIGIIGTIFLALNLIGSALWLVAQCL